MLGFVAGLILAAAVARTFALKKGLKKKRIRTFRIWQAVLGSGRMREKESRKCYHWPLIPKDAPWFAWSVSGGLESLPQAWNMAEVLGQGVDTRASPAHGPKGARGLGGTGVLLLEHL